MLALVALTGVFAFDPIAFAYTLLIFALGAAYYAFHGRYHLVAKSADEEFALLARAEAGLDDR